MKYLFLFLSLLAFLCIGIVAVGYLESRNLNRLKQREIDGLRKQNASIRDSLTQELSATRDSLNIAFATIRLSHEETERAKERSQREIKALREIVFTVHTDSSRTATLKQLYKSYE